MSRDSLHAKVRVPREARVMKSLAVFLIIGGLVLAMVGLFAMSAASSDISRFAEGAIPAPTAWILLAGVAVFVTGLAALFRAFRSRD
jgi:uncharacterized membrane protein YidH (DUF202 family)